MSSDSVGETFSSLKPKSFSGEGNFFENFMTDVTNYGLQALTVGTVGYNGKTLDNGVATNAHREGRRAAMNGLKEVTGANAAEEANRQARAQFEQSKIDAEAARAESIAQVGRDQVQQSRTAGAARNATRSSANKGTAVSSYSLGADEKDYLGL
jgi:hypothetical protein